MLATRATVTWVLLGIAYLFGASSATGQSSPRDSAGITIVENQRPAREQPWRTVGPALVRIGDQVGRAEYELFRVRDAVRLSGGEIVIANGGSGEVRWYSAAGVFLRKVGKAGVGPGEFEFLSKLLVLPGDSVAAYDVAQQRLTVFGPAGNLARTLRIEGIADGPVVINRFPDGSYLFVTGGLIRLGGQGPVRVERNPIAVYRFAEDRRPPEQLAEFPGIEMDIGPTGGVGREGGVPIGRTPRPFSRSTGVVASPVRWIVGDNDRPELRFYDPSGRPTLLVRWAAQARSVTARDIELDRAQRLSRQQDPAVKARLAAAYEERPAPPATMPAFDSRLLLDAGGNVWVKQYSPPAERDPNRFDVFSSTGVWVGSVTAPAGLKLLAIGDDWLLGASEGALGVETVSLHRLSR